MTRDATDAAGMAPLQRLITERMRDQGWEPRDVEARGVKHATLHRYMNPVELKQLPRRDVLQALADALTLNYDRVLEAAKDSVGWTSDGVTVLRLQGAVDPRPVGYDLDREADGLPDEDVEHIRANIRALRRARGLDA